MPTNPTQRCPSPVPRESDPQESEPADADAAQESAQTDHDEPTEPAKAESTSDWSRKRRITAAVLAVLVVLAAAGTWYLATRPGPADVQPTVSQQGDYTPGSIPSQPGAAAVRAAVDTVPRILSYDYRTLDKHVGSVKGAMTPEFTATFTETFTSAVKPMATENKAVTKALVRGAGIASMSEDDSQADLLLFVDQVLVTSKGRNSEAAQPRVGQERVAVTMRNVNGTWLVDDIRPF